MPYADGGRGDRLLLGLVSWGLGAAAVIRPGIRWTSAVSLLSCCVSLLVQLAEVHRLTELGDWSALMDTMEDLIVDGFAAAVVALIGYSANKRKHTRTKNEP